MFPFCSDCVDLVCAPLMKISDSCDRTLVISVKTSLSIAPEPTFLFEIGEIDAAMAAHQEPIPVEVSVLVAPKLSLWGELTQVWALEVGSDRSLGQPKE